MRSVIGAVLLPFLVASAGSYADRPCQAPAPLARYEELTLTYNQLTSKADELDATVNDFNKRCNVQHAIGSPEDVACSNQMPGLKSQLQTQHDSVAQLDQQLRTMVQGTENNIDSQLSDLEQRRAGIAARLAEANGNHCLFEGCSRLGADDRD